MSKADEVRKAMVAAMKAKDKRKKRLSVHALIRTEKQSN